MMSEIKLKPCPCCGTEAYTHFTDLKSEVLYGYISCNNSTCGLEMRFRIEPSNVLLDFDDVVKGMDDVVKTWNRRVGERNGSD